MPNRRSASQTTEAILDAASWHFGAFEYPHVSVSAIARSANVSPPAVYSYFRSKYDLYRAVVDVELARAITSAWGAGADAEPLVPQVWPVDDAPFRLLVSAGPGDQTPGGLFCRLVDEFQRRPVLEQASRANDAEHLMQLPDLTVCAHLSTLNASLLGTGHDEEAAVALGASLTMLHVAVALTRTGAPVSPTDRESCRAFFDGEIDGEIDGPVAPRFDDSRTDQVDGAASPSTRDRIMTVAVEHFGALGYPRVSVAAIAREVGTSQPNIYTYFASKEALYQKAVGTALAAAIAEIGPCIAEGRPDNVLCAVLAELVPQVAKRPILRQALRGTDEMALTRLPNVAAQEQLTDLVARASAVRPGVASGAPADVGARTSIGATTVMFSLALATTHNAESSDAERLLAVGQFLARSVCPSDGLPVT